VEEELRILSIKLNKLSKSYKKLKEDNDRLQADIGYLRRETENHKDRLIENKVLKDKQMKVIKKLESLLKKMSKSE
jgi:FtsZ-binding cell division protein ZapB